MVYVIFYGGECAGAYRRFQLAFPYGKHVPSHLVQTLLLALVALFVAFDFVAPELGVRFRYVEMLFMSVSEASVDKNHDAVFPQNYVGGSRQPLHILAETVAFAP